MLIGFKSTILVTFIAALSFVSTVFSAQPGSGQTHATKSTGPLVFFLHGFKGTTGSFCDLPQILANRFGQSALDTQILTYATDSADEVVLDAEDRPVPVDNRNVELFALQVHLQIKGAFELRGLPANHPYVIIAHSQGGLVATHWYHDFIVNKQCEKYPGPCPDNLRMMITLGTPFLGSPVASFLKENQLTDIMKGLEKLGVPPLVPKQQLEDLALASPLVLSTADKIRSIQNRVLKNLSDLVHIGGDDGTVIQSQKFNEIRPEYQSFEWDGVVPLFSSFSASFNRQSEYSLLKPLLQKIFYYPIVGSHAWGPTDIACSKKEQAKDKLVVQLIQLHVAKILGVPVTNSESKAYQRSDQFIPKLNYFHVVVRGQLPNDWNKTYPLKYFTIKDKFNLADSTSPEMKPGLQKDELIEDDATSGQFSIAGSHHIANLMKFRRFGTKFFGVNQEAKITMNEVGFYTTGKFFDRAGQPYDPNVPHLSEIVPDELTFHLNHPWFEPETIKVPVAAGFSSMVKMKMRPKSFANATCFRGKLRRKNESSNTDRERATLNYWSEEKPNEYYYGGFNLPIIIHSYRPDAADAGKGHVSFRFVSRINGSESKKVYVTDEANIRIQALCSEPDDFPKLPEPTYL